MTTQKIVENPVPGVWYRSDMHLPPKGVKYIKVNAKGQWTQCVGNANNHLFSVFAWQVPSLPVDMFFEVKNHCDEHG